MDLRERLYQAVAFVEVHLTEEISLDDVASVACYSRYHFQRIFHASSGVTIGEYIQTRRITESARMLLSTTHSILSVAVEFQFKSHEHFSRLFRKLIGVTPSQFRKQGSAQAPKFLEPFTRDDFSFDFDRADSCIAIVEMPEHQVFALTAESPEFSSVADTWATVQELSGIDQVDLRGMIHYPEEISVEIPFQYSVIASKPAKGLTPITLPAAHYAEFRYCGDIRNISNMYRYIYCIWMDREGYRNPFNFDMEMVVTESAQGPTEMKIIVPVESL